MKLDSLPTERALAEVISAAMKWGPVRLSRIAMETGIPLETCRYYLNRFHKTGYRFFPEIDYNAIGLEPHVVILRLAKEWQEQPRELNIIRWLENIYVTYRAALSTPGEYLFHVAVPKGDGKQYRRLLEELIRLNVLEHYTMVGIEKGYYLARWIQYYDFFNNTWRKHPIDVAGHTIPITSNRLPSHLDPIDLKILARLEYNPKITNLEVSKELSISPQLVSYHRQKHIEGQGLILGYTPGWLTEPPNWITAIEISNNIDSSQYSHLILDCGTYCLERIHAPTESGIAPHVIPFREKSIVRYTIPIEHYNVENKTWTKTKRFVEIVEAVVLGVSKTS